MRTILLTTRLKCQIKLTGSFLCKIESLHDTNLDTTLLKSAGIKIPPVQLCYVKLFVRKSATKRKELGQNFALNFRLKNDSFGVNQIAIAEKKNHSHEGNGKYPRNAL